MHRPAERKLRYGNNVEWFLNDIAQTELDDIESGEFEILGEDGRGQEISAIIDITELVADAAQIIAELRQKLDAVAAENMSLKAFMEARCWVYEDDVQGYRDAVNYLPAITATDANLNPVRAEGIHFAANRILASWKSGFINDTPEKVYDMTGAVLTALEFLPNASPGEFTRDYADQVRSAIAGSLVTGESEDGV